MSQTLKLVANVLQDVKLEDIVIYDFKEYSPHYDYQVIASANSERQANAVVNHLKQALPEDIYLHVEGRENNRWILVDLKDVVLHVMHKEDREFYQLEKIFFEREKISLEDVNGL